MSEKNMDTKAITEFSSSKATDEVQAEPTPVEVTAATLVETTDTATSSEQDLHLQKIASSILTHKDKIACSFLEIGELLIEAKTLLTKHGEWMKWLTTKVNIHYRTAERYMQLANAYGNSTTVTNLGIAKSMALLSLPEMQRNSFINEPHEVNGKQKTVYDMSVREMRRIIHEQVRPAQADNVTNKKFPLSQAEICTIFHKFDRTRPKTQSTDAAFSQLSADITAAQTHIDSILKILKEQVPNGIEESQFADDLIFLLKKAVECLNLANINI